MRNRCIVLFFLLIFLLSGCTNQKTTGNDWAMNLSSTYSDLEQASKSITDLYALYFIGAVESSDFQNEKRLLQTQLRLSQRQYEHTKSDINPGSHSYASKAIQEALDKAYDDTLTFLSCTNEPDDLSTELYAYLEWRDSFITDIATYLTAKNLILEAKEELNE